MARSATAHAAPRCCAAARAIAAVVLGALVRTAGAATDFQQCCAQVPVAADLKPFQWDACHASFNASETDPVARFAPPIYATLAWCQHHCEPDGMFQVSQTNQWLTPLAAWVIPAVAMLFLIPISEELKAPRDLALRTTMRAVLDEFVLNWLEPAMGYVQVLGDPTSAFNGALSQMMNDWTLCVALRRPTNSDRECALISTVILAEQADFEVEVVRNIFEIMSGLGKARDYSKTACRVMFSARKKFNMSVALPVAFYVGVAAAVFYDAAQKLGDNDTAHSLAYGVWYNWILLLSVFSNCFATHVSLEAVRSGLEVILRGVVENHTYQETKQIGWDRTRVLGPTTPRYELAAFSLMPYPPPPMASVLATVQEDAEVPATVIEIPRPRLYSGTIEIKAVPLHRRYFNTMKWNRWLHSKGVDVRRPTKGAVARIPGLAMAWTDWSTPRHHTKTRYLACQVLSWTFVLFPTLCAATISYTTPNVTLGCRSFNHLLYAALALLIAILRVPKDALEGDAPAVEGDPRTPKHPWTYRAVAFTYHTLLWANGLVVLIGGTTLQLIGGYRNCLCSASLFNLGPDSLILMSQNTFLQQFWARQMWVQMGLFAYGGVVAICMVGLAVRLYISYSIRAFLQI